MWHVFSRKKASRLSLLSQHGNEFLLLEVISWQLIPLPLSEVALALENKPDDEEGRSNEEVRQQHVDIWSCPLVTELLPQDMRRH